ncbi:MAG: fluoride efflux transporter CrcB [Alphaproteobacteria bacterium]
MISTIAVIGIGGALGALTRYGVNLGAVHVLGHGFPWGTLIVNILGSFLMGILIAKFAQMGHISGELRHLCATGFLGAFTTFSTFSLDFVTLWERGEFVQAGGYMAVSVVLSILALFLALWIMRGLAS